MKRSFSFLILIGLAGFIVAGCGGSSGSSGSNSNVVCDAYGNCYSTTGTTGTGTLPPNAVVLATTGSYITITNSAQYDAFLRSIGACNNSLNTCSGYDTAPYVQVEVDDYTWPTNSGSTGNLTIYVEAGPVNAVVNYKEINNNTGFQTAIQTNPSLTGWGSVSGTGGLLTVTMNGLVTDSTVPIVLNYNGNVIGTGTLTRVSQ